MSNAVYTIADTHLGHSKILEFEKEARPFVSIKEHDEFVIDQWNSVVRPKDTVWHLGDVGFGLDMFRLLPRLNGIKKLVMGNHDRYPTRLYLEHFSVVLGAAKVRNCILTHIPIHPSQFYRFKGNIHGHLHSQTLDHHRYKNVSCEHVGFKPVLLDKIVEEFDYD